MFKILAGFKEISSFTELSWDSQDNTTTEDSDFTKLLQESLHLFYLYLSKN